MLLHLLSQSSTRSDSSLVRRLLLLVHSPVFLSLLILCTNSPPVVLAHLLELIRIHSSILMLLHLLIQSSTRSGSCLVRILLTLVLGTLTGAYTHTLTYADVATFTHTVVHLLGFVNGTYPDWSPLRRPEAREDPHRYTIHILYMLYIVYTLYTVYILYTLCTVSTVYILCIYKALYHTQLILLRQPEAGEDPHHYTIHI